MGVSVYCRSGTEIKGCLLERLSGQYAIHRQYGAFRKERSGQNVLRLTGGPDRLSTVELPLIRFGSETESRKARLKKWLSTNGKKLINIFYHYDFDFAERKGARFITSNRYSQYQNNWPWAEAVEDLCAATRKNLEDGIAPAQILSGLAVAYGEVVAQNPSLNMLTVENFGVPRNYLDVIPIGAYGTDRAYAKYHQKLEANFARSSVPKDPVEDFPFSSYFIDGNMTVFTSFSRDKIKHSPKFNEIDRVLNYQLEIDGKPVTLMKTFCYADDKGLWGSKVRYLLYMETPHPKVMAFICKLVSETVALKKLPKTPETLQKAVENIATLHWAFSCSMPYRRGSAGIADILTKVLFDYLEIKTPCWKKGNSPDLEAMVTPNLQEYIAEYPKLFDGELQFKQPPQRESDLVAP